jgi:hypothetical protein
MRSRFALLVVLGVLVTVTLSAQTKISGQLSCAKADPMYTIPMDDGNGTVMGLARVACTWSKAIEMAGSTGKDGYGVAAFEMHGG